ncbi:hypothetical protein [Virgisporangium aliadipatigenens]|nr:hypothetical protein [Virgisporangium aliadipatigenens]
MNAHPDVLFELVRYHQADLRREASYHRLARRMRTALRGRHAGRPVNSTAE